MKKLLTLIALFLSQYAVVSQQIELHKAYKHVNSTGTGNIYDNHIIELHDGGFLMLMTDGVTNDMFETVNLDVNYSTLIRLDADGTYMWNLVLDYRHSDLEENQNYAFKRLLEYQIPNTNKYGYMVIGQIRSSDINGPGKQFATQVVGVVESQNKQSAIIDWALTPYFEYPNSLNFNANHHGVDLIKTNSGKYAGLSFIQTPLDDKDMFLFEFEIDPVSKKGKLTNNQLPIIIANDNSGGNQAGFNFIPLGMTKPETGTDNIYVYGNIKTEAGGFSPFVIEVENPFKVNQSVSAYQRYNYITYDNIKIKAFSVYQDKVGFMFIQEVSSQDNLFVIPIDLTSSSLPVIQAGSYRLRDNKYNPLEELQDGYVHNGDLYFQARSVPYPNQQTQNFLKLDQYFSDAGGGTYNFNISNGMNRTVMQSSFKKSYSSVISNGLVHAVGVHVSGGNEHAALAQVDFSQTDYSCNIIPGWGMVGCISCVDPVGLDLVVSGDQIISGNPNQPQPENWGLYGDIICSSCDEFSVTAPDYLCPGETDQVTVTPTSPGAGLTYTYNWTTVPVGCASCQSSVTSSTMTIDAAGYYKVEITVSDANGPICSEVLSFNVLQGYPPSLTLYSKHNSFCDGTGFFIVKIGGQDNVNVTVKDQNSNNYTPNFIEPARIFEVTGLNPADGPFDITVTSTATGCTSTTSVSLTQTPPEIEILEPYVSCYPSSCANDIDKAIVKIDPTHLSSGSGDLFTWEGKNAQGGWDQLGTTTIPEFKPAPPGWDTYTEIKVLIELENCPDNTITREFNVQELTPEVQYNGIIDADCSSPNAPLVTVEFELYFSNLPPDGRVPSCFSFELDNTTASANLATETNYAVGTNSPNDQTRAIYTKQFAIDQVYSTTEPSNIIGYSSALKFSYETPSCGRPLDVTVDYLHLDHYIIDYDCHDETVDIYPHITNEYGPLSYDWTDLASASTISTLSSLLDFDVSNVTNYCDQFSVELSVENDHGCQIKEQFDVPEDKVEKPTVSTQQGCNLEVTLQTCNSTAAVDPINISVFDMGQTPRLLVASKQGGMSSSPVTLEKLPAGQYVVEVTDKNGCVRDIEHGIPAANKNMNLCFWFSPTEEEEPEPPVVEFESIEDAMDEVVNSVANQIEKCKESQGALALSKWNNVCLNPDLVESKVHMDYQINQKNHTLYFYDRAGNLTQTVSPENSKMGLSRNTAISYDYNTEYKPNSFGNTVASTSPDAYAKTFVYLKETEQVRFSQSMKQDIAGEFSYSLYDSKNRVVETGVVEDAGFYNPGSASSAVNDPDYVKIYYNNGDIDHTKTVPYGDYLNPGNSLFSTIKERTYIKYSEPASGITYFGEAQKYLHDRISYSYNDNETYTYYSYDPHGNVEWMIHDIPEIGKVYLRYEYDVLTGNVTQVAYNEFLKDRFFHKYEYDTDNRITKVMTSTNGIYWEEDADYYYYPHGPLARTELGEDIVQGLDYTYTVEGWLKAINYPGKNAVDYSAAKDPGVDEEIFPYDIYSLGLNYYDDDYVQDNFNNSSSAQNLDDYTANSPSLYNGNISSIAYGIDGGQLADDITAGGRLEKNDVTIYKYHYDVLNRLKLSRVGGHSDNDGSLTTIVDNWETNYSYSPSGNITSLQRNNQDGDQMDDFAYQYTTNTNKQYGLVEQTQSSANGTGGDIAENHSYMYDPDGNLKRETWTSTVDGDDFLNTINLTWYANGKVKEAKIKSIEVGTSAIEKDIELYFTYDANGNRVTKKLVDNQASEENYSLVYARDAQGNVMATYKVEYSDIGTTKDPVESSTVSVIEQPVYGSSRLGLRKPDAESQVVYEGPIEAKPEPGDVQHEHLTEKLHMTVHHLDGSTQQWKNYLIKEDFNDNFTFGGTYAPDVTSQVSDLGRKGYVACENEKGEVQFYFIIDGASNEVHILNRNHQPMDDPHSIMSTNTYYGDPNCRPIALRRSVGNTYYVFYRQIVGTNHRLGYFLINMNHMGGTPAGSNPLGKIHQINGTAMSNYRFDHNDYTGVVGRNFFGIDNYTDKFSRLFFTTYENDGTTTLRWADVVNNIPNFNNSYNSSDMVSMGGSYNVNGDGKMDISPDGKQLAVVLFDDGSGYSQSSRMNGYIQLYGLDDNFDPTFAQQSPNISLTPDYHGMVFSHFNDHIYLSSKTGSSSGICKDYDIGANSYSNLYSSDIPYGEMARGHKFRYYIFEEEFSSNGMEITYFSHFNNTQVVLNDRYTHAQGTELKAISQQPHRVVPYSALTYEQPYQRHVNEKQYELTDHLGNVRAVVSGKVQMASGGSIVVFHNNHNADGGNFLCTDWSVSNTSCASVSCGSNVHYDESGCGQQFAPGVSLTLNNLITGRKYTMTFSATSGVNVYPYGSSPFTFTATGSSMDFTFSDITKTSYYVYEVKVEENWRTANVLSVQDYYPFGSPLPQRTANISEDDYRYGFNGQEKDDQLRGAAATSLDFGARLYDPRLGRWLSVDPRADKYPYNSTFASFGNNPVYYIDPGGETLKVSWADPAHVETYKAAVSLAFSGKVQAQVSEEGIVTFNQLPETNLNEYEKAAFGTLKKIEEAELVTRQKLVGAKEGKHNLGAFRTDQPSLLNVDVLIKLGTDDNTLNTRAGLIHETAENYKKAEMEANRKMSGDYFEDFDQAHDYALQEEAKTTNLKRTDKDNSRSLTNSMRGSTEHTMKNNGATLNGKKGTYQMKIYKFNPSNKIINIEHSFTPRGDQ